MQKRVLEEDDYVHALERIIARDYFPNTYNGDDEGSIDIDNYSLDQFVSKYTTEDNHSFDKLMEKDAAERRRKFHWMYDQNDGRVPGMLMLYYVNNGRNKPLTAVQRMKIDKAIKDAESEYNVGYDQRPAGPDTWNRFHVRNALMFPPDDSQIPKSNEQHIEVDRETKRIANIAEMAEGNFLKVLTEGEHRNSSTGEETEDSVTGKALPLMLEDQPPHARVSEPHSLLTMPPPTTTLNKYVKRGETNDQKVVDKRFIARHNSRLVTEEDSLSNTIGSSTADGWSDVASVLSDADALEKKTTTVSMTPALIPYHGTSDDAGLRAALHDEDESLVTSKSLLQDQMQYVEPLFTWGELLADPVLLGEVRPIETTKRTQDTNKPNVSNTSLRHNKYTAACNPALPHFEITTTARDKLAYRLGTPSMTAKQPPSTPSVLATPGRGPRTPAAQRMAEKLRQEKLAQSTPLAGCFSSQYR